jgi:DnaJ-class molecular chaperone
MEYDLPLTTKCSNCNGTGMLYYKITPMAYDRIHCEVCDGYGTFLMEELELEDVSPTTSENE